jgi:hypothetical protein
MPTSNDKDPSVVYLSNLALFSVLITLETWLFTLYALLARDPLQQLLCGTLTFAATLFLLTVGRPAMGGRWPRLQRGQDIGVTASQVWWVILCMVAAARLQDWVLD